MLPVVSTKYDGSPHYAYEVQVIAVEPGHLFAWQPAGSPSENPWGTRTTSVHHVHVHPRCRDWNLVVMFEPDWQPREHYVNVALPSRWDDGTLRFVDLDLDVVWRVDGTVALLDEDEFDEHRTRFGYPEDLVARCWRSVDEVMGLIAERAWPLDGSLYSWRP